MIYIGNHLSISNGYPVMARAAQALGGDCFAFFTRNPRGGKSRTPSAEETAELLELVRENGFGPAVAHGAYTMNLCAAAGETRRKGYEMLRDDLIRMKSLPGMFYNFHPGSHVGQGTEKGIALIAEALNGAIRESGNEDTVILLETMAGKGSEVGARFEELRAIMDLAEEPDRIGVCMDSCHVWDGGYDIAGSLDAVLAEFDRVIGLSRLRALHLNDSKNPLGSHKDRHEKLGRGTIGSEALQRLVQHPLLQGRPFILETPNDDEGYREEIARVRQWREEKERR